MDIHPSDRPAHSLKDFAIHILIVTIGILIALGLEGVREVWREHVAVAEARESFRTELHLNQEQLRRELASVRKVNQGLDTALAGLTSSTAKALDLSGALSAIRPGFYFFRTTAWDSAIAGGALAHMNAGELNRFTDAYLSVRHYQDAQKAALPEWLAVQAYFQSHRHVLAADREYAEEKLRSFQSEMQLMTHVGSEMDGDLTAALPTEH